MTNQLIIKKGRNLSIKGKPETDLGKAGHSATFGVNVYEFPSIKPKLSVKEQDQVQIGDSLFFDKLNPEVQFVSPASGTVEQIIRGDRRAIQKIIIKSDGAEQYKSFEKYSYDAISKASAETITKALMEGGMWPALIQRPFSIIANAKKAPKSIFVNATHTEPLALSASLALKGKGASLKAGLLALTKLTQGKVFLCVLKSDAIEIEASQLPERVELVEVQGAHPAGNSSTHIHHLDRLAKGQIVWAVKAVHVAMIGSLLTEGKYLPHCTIAVAGPSVQKPGWIQTQIGAEIKSVTKNNISEGLNRFVSGSVLGGLTNDADGFVGFYKQDLTILPEGNKRSFMGWLMPGFNYLSFSRAFASALSPKKAFNVDTNLHGSHRAIVATDIYDRYLPMDILSVPLIKSVLAEDTERAENLGLLECDPEDFSLASFMCPSKIDLCQIIQNGLNQARKELE